jgi:CubicO group peptidase (beta-lactamase class C family)
VLVGLALDKGYIESVNDNIGKYLDGIVNFPDETKKNITIEQLLKMSFGHSWNGTSSASLYENWANSPDQLQFIIDLPLVNTPGSVFNYSDGSSHLLSVIISEATGQNTLDFAKTNLFDPLDIQKFEWSIDDKGYPNGAAGLRVTPADMVKFGNLILNKGKYNGKQVVPETWISAMTTTKISTDNDVLYGPEYGYQIWIGNSSGHKYLMAMGWGGQFIFIVPDQNLVVTATCWTSDLTWEQAGQHWTSIIKIIVEKIFPAVH